MELLKSLSMFSGVLLAMSVICTSVFLLLFGILFLDDKGEHIKLKRKTVATVLLSFGGILLFSFGFVIFVYEHGPLICHLFEQLLNITF